MFLQESIGHMVSPPDVVRHLVSPSEMNHLLLAFLTTTSCLTRMDCDACACRWRTGWCSGISASAPWRAQTQTACDRKRLTFDPACHELSAVLSLMSIGSAPYRERRGQPALLVLPNMGIVALRQGPKFSDTLLEPQRAD